MKQKEILLNYETCDEIDIFLHEDLKDHIDLTIKTLKHLDIMRHRKIAVKGNEEVLHTIDGTDLVDAILMKIDYAVIKARKERRREIEKEVLGQ